MATGVVKKVTDRGFGFIRRDGGNDLFVHLKDCGDEVRRRFDESLIGERVEFDMQQDATGRERAVNVRLSW